MASYLVTAPYVTTAVLDANGAEVTLGFYEGGVIEDPVEGEHLDKLLRAGYIEKGSVPYGAGADSPDSNPDTVQAILDDVGDDKDKAATALETEQAKGDGARKTLVSKLEAIVNA